MSVRNLICMVVVVPMFCTNIWAMENVTVGPMEDVKPSGGMREVPSPGSLRNVAPPKSVNSGRPSLSRDELATLFVQGGNLLREKRFREAAEAFTQVISAAPNFDSAWAFRGFALGAMGPDNYERAHEDFCKAIELNPRNQHAYYGRAMINRARDQDYGSDLNMAAQLGHKKAQQMLQNASAGSNMPQANNGRGTMPEARPITRVEPREITRVEPREITRVEPREITRVEPREITRVEAPSITRNGEAPSITRNGEAPSITRNGEAPSITRNGEAPSISRVEIDADSKRRGKTIDPHGQGLNQAQIDAMEAIRRNQVNVYRPGGMCYGC